jgi:hypothetical protein
MKGNRGLLGWGLFFIVLGAVPLAVRAGAIDREVVRRAWELWPLILVGIGLGLVLERTRLAIVGGLVVAATFGLMGGALLAGGIDAPIGIAGCSGGTSQGEPFAEQRGDLAGTEPLVDIELDCGELAATTAAGTGWMLSGTSPDGLPPDVRSGPGRLTIRSLERRGVTIGATGSRWDLVLPRDVPARLDISVNAGSATLHLGGMPVMDLSTSVNAGELDIDLGETTSVQTLNGSVNAGSMQLSIPRPDGPISGNLSVNAGSIELCVPEGVAMRFRMDDPPLGSNNFGDRGLQRQGDSTWITPGFAGGAALQLVLSANLGSITLNPEDGCAD